MTQNSTHTPGPWARNISAKYPIYAESDHKHVAHCIADRSMTEGEIMANLRLIAAAPDMLAALQRARFLLESPVIAHLVNGAGALDEINAAIAKATA